MHAPLLGESGVGYLLRLAASNGISMHKLRQLAGMTEAETFTAKHAGALFSLVGLGDTAQSGILPQRARGTSTLCYGHRFRVRTMLRFRRPQLCSACIRETRICAAHWDLAVSVVCLKHRCFLQDVCPTCHTSIRWNRPTVDWGHCRHSLAGPAGHEYVPEALFSAQRITEQLLRHQTADFSALIPYPTALSLDAFGSLLWALGLIEIPYSVPPRNVITRVPSALEARVIVLRAVTRLESCLKEGTSFSGLAPVVVEAPLAGSILDPACDADRIALLSFYSSIFGERQAAALLRRHRVLHQMGLF